MRHLIYAGCFLLSAPAMFAGSIAQLPDLQSVTVYEATSGTSATTFNLGDARLTTRLGSLLGSGNNDLSSFPGEYYDFFFSNSDGTANPLGAFFTIEATWFDAADPTDNQYGSMNINEVFLNFGGASPYSIHADSVDSFVYGVNYGGSLSLVNGSESKAIDGNLSTYPQFGYTPNTSSHMALTLGFTPVPEPALVSLVALGVPALLMFRRKRSGQGS